MRSVRRRAGRSASRGLVKSFGDVRALDGVDLEVAARHRARPARPQRRRQDDRRARPHDAAAARRRRRPRRRPRRRRATPPSCASSIGLAGQYAAVDENLTGLENLEMVGRLYGERRARGQGARGASCSSASTSSTPPTARPRPTRAACAAASTSPPRWSPRPPVLFLDEPTTGLDPRSRLELWETIEELVADGHDRAAHDPVPRRGRPARRPRSP